jgi:acyl-CoA thioesterase II
MSALSDLLTILDLEPAGNNLWRGVSPQVGWGRIFGGLVIAQALVAAMRSVAPDRHPHSLHAYFILPGDPDKPIFYETENLRDGRSFATRRVVARQDGAAIFALSASFHVEEQGYTHQAAMPAVAAPETLLSEKDIITSMGAALPEGVQRYFLRERPIELKPMNLRRYMGAKDKSVEQTPERLGMEHQLGMAHQNVWFRATGPVPADAAIQTALLAYASDMALLDTALVVHGKSVFSADIQAASMDHAMWFHRPADLNDWLLYAMDSPSASGALGLSRGLIYNRDGMLVASVMQEGLIRPRPERSKLDT